MTAHRLMLCDAPGMVLEDLLPFFRELGFTCTYVESARELDLHETAPDAIILAAEVPGGARGPDFLHLRRIFPETPLLVVAHVRGLSAAVEYFRAGIADYLPVPLSPRETRERILAALPQDTDDEAVEVPVEFEPLPASEGGVDPERLPCGVLLLDSEGALLRSNEAACQLFGVDEAGLRKRFAQGLGECQPLDLHEKPLAPEMWPPLAALRAKAFRSATVGLRRPDHSRVWLHVDAAPHVDYGRVRAVHVSLVNVTDYVAELRKLRSLRH